MKIKNIINILPYIAIVIMLITNECKSNVDYNDSISTQVDSTYTPVKIDSVKTTFDYVVDPTPVIVYKENPVNKELLDKFKESQNKIKLYEDAIRNNKYVEVFEDSIQKVTVHSDVQGKLIKQRIETVIKEREAPCYTKTITNTIIKHDRAKVFLGLDTDLTLDLTSPRLTPSIMYKTPNNNIYKLGINKEGVRVGFYINLW